MTDKVKNKDKNKLAAFNLDILRPERKERLDTAFPDGDAFQQLCFDLLKDDFAKKQPSVRLSLFPTRGADGAIDISGEDEFNHKMFGECKKNNSPDNARDELNKLRKKMFDHLAKEPAEIENTLYAPWLDPKLTSYVYCVSCSIDTQKDMDDLTAGIREMFIELSSQPHLGHLKEVSDHIALYTWNDLKLLLEDNRFLYHKWVKDDYFDGVEALSRHIDPSRVMYRDYLSSVKLPYFSRDQYVKENPQAQRPATETEILETLLDNPRYHGCILYGEGGIGKTRLTLELGFMAEQRGRIVYRITHKNPDLDKLKTLFYPTYNYLLLFDYIEELGSVSSVSYFDAPDFFRRLTSLVPGAGIKVLGNCRKTHIDASQLKDAEGFFTRDLSIKNRQIEQDYKNRVVKHTLGDLDRFFKVEKSFYELRPAFAVFLRYLDEKNPLPEEDLDFRSEAAFREWLKKQLVRTFKKRYEELSGLKDYFHIFFILSSSAGVPFEPINDDFEAVVEALLKDGWVEKEEVNGSEQLKIIHDTIAEEILILRLRDREEELKTEINGIFDFAFKYNGGENCFRLFERISDWVHDPQNGEPTISKNNSVLFYRLFSQDIAGGSGRWDSIKKFLATTPLMDDPHIVSLLSEHTAYFDQVFREEKFGLIVAMQMRYMFKNRAFYSHETREQVKNRLNTLLETWFAEYPGFFDFCYISSRIISSVVEYDGLKAEWVPGVTVEEKAKEWLEKYPLEMETSFVIKSWLDAGGEKETAASFVAPCLKNIPWKWRPTL